MYNFETVDLLTDRTNLTLWLFQETVVLCVIYEDGSNKFQIGVVVWVLLIVKVEYKKILWSSFLGTGGWN